MHTIRWARNKSSSIFPSVPSGSFLQVGSSKFQAATFGSAARTSPSENPPVSVTFLKINVPILTASMRYVKDE